MDSFPVKLHACLSELEQSEQSHIASFQPHGRAIKVHKPNDFLAVLPRFFNMTKIESFQRQLNFYGFQRITRGPDKNAYFHPLFQRDYSALAIRIPRLGNKGAGPRQAVQCCPDFTTLPTGHAMLAALTNLGLHAELSEPNMVHPNMAHPNMAHPNIFHPNMAHPNMAHPNMAHPTTAQLILNRLSQQQSVHPLTTATSFQGVNLSSSTAPAQTQYIPQPPFASVSATSTAQGALLTDHRAERLALAMDLNRQSRLQQQQELEQRVRRQQQLELEQRVRRQRQQQELEQHLCQLQQLELQRSLASAAPPLPLGETASLLHATLRRQKLERQYQDVVAARELALAQSIASRAHSHDASLQSLVPPTVRGYQPQTGLSHRHVAMLRDLRDARGGMNP